jgi:hypothetical protein
VIVTVRRLGRPTLLVRAVDGVLGTHRVIDAFSRPGDLAAAAGGSPAVIEAAAASPGPS